MPSTTISPPVPYSIPGLIDYLTELPFYPYSYVHDKMFGHLDVFKDGARIFRISEDVDSYKWIVRVVDEGKTYSGQSINGVLYFLKEEFKAKSWVVKRLSDGEILFETYDRETVNRLNTEKYMAVPILQHLQELSREIKDSHNKELKQ